MNAYRFAALVRRELWERRWFIRTWLILSGLLIVSGLAGLTLIGFFSKAFSIRVQPQITHPGGGIVFLALAGIFGAILLLRLTVYFLHTLHDDRMDRSYVFWKSLPVSDTMTVASKVFTGLIVVPLIAWVCLIVTGILLLFLLSLATSFLGHHFWGSFWAFGPLVSVWFYLAVAFILLPLWIFPLFAWMLLCSAWANQRSRRSPFFMAFGVPVVIIILEPLLLGTHLFSTWLGQLFSPPGQMFSLVRGHGVSMTRRWLELTHLPAHAEFWLGGLVGLAFIAGAIYFRHRPESNR